MKSLKAGYLNIMKRLKTPAVIFILFFAVAVVMTFPAILHLDSRVVGVSSHPGFQGELFFEKNILYNAQKGNLFHWFRTDLVNYPAGQDIGLRVANSLHLYFSLFFTAFFSLIVSYNMLAIVILALNGFTMYLLARDFFPSRPVSFCAGLFFTLNSYVLLKMNMGFTHKINLVFLPLYVLCLFRVLNGKRNTYLFGAAFFLFLVKLSYPPYAYYAIMFTAALLAYDLINTRGVPRFSKKVFLIMALFMSFVFLFDFYMAGSSVFSPKSLSFEKNLPPLMMHGQVDIFHPFRSILPFPTNLPFGVSILGVILGCYAAFLKKGLSRFFFITAVVCFIISAGPYLAISGKPLVLLNHKITLPYYFLYKYTPSVYGEGLILPIRIFPVLNICLALLTGYSLTHIAGKIAKKGAFIAAVLFILFYFLENLMIFPELFPMRTSRLNIPEFYRKIKNEKFKAMLNLPVSENREITNRYCYYAALSDKNIMNSYDNKELCVSVPESSDGADIKERFIKRLDELDVRYVVIHKGLSGSDDAFGKDTEWLAGFCGFPVDYDSDKLLVYRIPDNKQTEKR